MKHIHALLKPIPPTLSFPLLYKDGEGRLLGLGFIFFKEGYRGALLLCWCHKLPRKHQTTRPKATSPSLCSSYGVCL